MIGQHLELLFAPGAIVLQPTSLGTRRQSADALSLVGGGANLADTDWRADLQTAASLLERHRDRGGRLQVALSGLWARSCVLSVASSSLSEAEVDVLVRTHFARQYPEVVQGEWIYRMRLIGPHLVAAGMQTALLQAIREAAAKSGHRLTRLAPVFSWTYDQAARELASLRGWMLLHEPGLLSLAFLERGTPISLHSQRCDGDAELAAPLLLERQSALLAQTSREVAAFSVGTQPMRLPSAWRVVLQQTLFQVGARPGMSPALADSAH